MVVRPRELGGVELPPAGAAYFTWDWPRRQVPNRPRRDRLERAPLRPEQVDRRLAQDLVDRFVAAGARYVFVGRRVRLKGPGKVVVPIGNHEDHLHARLRP